MGNKLRHEGDEVRIKVIWPDTYYNAMVKSWIPPAESGAVSLWTSEFMREPSQKLDCKLILADGHTTSLKK